MGLREILGLVLLISYNVCGLFCLDGGVGWRAGIMSGHSGHERVEVLEFAPMCGSEMVKTFAQLQLVVIFFFLLPFLTQTKRGPNGRTYIENLSDLIPHEKEPVPVISP